jgi:predicted dehydrogenase
MNRRGFLQAAAAPMIASPRIFGANSRLKVGVIGVGNRARWLMQYFGREVDEVDLVAVADCYLVRCYGKDPAMQRSTPFNEGSDRWAKYSSYHRMFDQEKLDAVWIETTTHARALAVIHAMQASLDVYAEKPIHLTVEEGRAMVKAAARYKRVFQAGSQQRSMPINRYASELVRNGKIGRIKTVKVCNYLPGLAWKPQPEQPVPEGLDWDVWCNQTELRPYHPTLHRQWSNYVDYDDGGESWGVSGWGTHGLDQVQCALGMDRTGPVEIWTEDLVTKDAPDFPLARNPNFSQLLNRKPVVMKFANGTQVELSEPGKNSHSQLGGIFVGDSGRIEIVRGDFTADPPELRKNAPPVLPEGKGEDVPHLKNFVECVMSRKQTNADVETAHRATTLCHLVSICRLLDRKLKWDPEAEKFAGDDEANRLLSRPRRKGYELPRV